MSSATGSSRATGPSRPPRSAIVIGAGMVGLATAWSLRNHGVEVSVVERRHPAAGASWGNAGWLSPALTLPLPEPAALRYGLRSLVSPESPVYIPPRPDPRLARFLLSFTRNCTPRRWRVLAATFATLNRHALEAYDALAADGVAEPTRPAEPCLLAFRTAAERAAMVEELEQARAAGFSIAYEPIEGDRARELEPTLGDGIGAALELHGQRYLNPGNFVRALADAVREHGGEILERTEVSGIRDLGQGVAVTTSRGQLRADVAVVATGAWLDGLVRPFGVRVPVQAGRGYSFSVPAEGAPTRPTYLAAQKVVCTPLGEGRVRVAGMMELAPVERPVDPRRIQAIIAAARPLLRGIDWEARKDTWVGARPCTPDGLPLVGPTASPRVYVNGGHGMWGVALGPLSGRLLAEAIATGTSPAELAPLHPLR
ncbi:MULTISPECIES: NAD(P)/FAD-dependent oxidoreductase [Streptomyces]|uniref:NAD(P)/FAD-dependent oxidoreductase n=1 Tax=Streptomyces TaxID=1883 RepID=UPI001424B6D4|nr:FAD-dependent oxidoreductase [Streptomyces sp. AgN23]AJZ86324.1 FAD-dependent oxidoreductase [Streptomyces sp. AgN23]WTB06884.1 FAD-binding oxidoreductase [Streptomyces antimycoticus]